MNITTYFVTRNNTEINFNLTSASWRIIQYFISQQGSFLTLNLGIISDFFYENPLDCKEIQPVHPKGDQSWVFIGRTDAEAETPKLWPPHLKSWLIGKDPDAGRDWGQEEKRTTEDEMAGWHHQFDGHGFEQTLGVGDGQGGLACCNSWGRKESDTTEWLNWTDWYLTSKCYFIFKSYLLEFQTHSIFS